MQCCLHVEQLTDLLLCQVAYPLAGGLAPVHAISQQLVSLRHFGELQLQLAHLILKLVVLNLHSRRQLFSEQGQKQAQQSPIVGAPDSQAGDVEPAYQATTAFDSSHGSA